MVINCSKSDVAVITTANTAIVSMQRKIRRLPLKPLQSVRQVRFVLFLVKDLKVFMVCPLKGSAQGAGRRAQGKSTHLAFTHTRFDYELPIKIISLMGSPT